MRLGAACAAGRGACGGGRGGGGDGTARGSRHRHGTGRPDRGGLAGGGAVRLSSGFGSGRLTPLAVVAAKASIGHSEAPSGQAGLQRLSSALARRAAAGNAQLRRLSPHVGELWSSAAEALNTQPVMGSLIQSRDFIPASL